MSVSIHEEKEDRKARVEIIRMTNVPSRIFGKGQKKLKLKVEHVVVQLVAQMSISKDDKFHLPPLPFNFAAFFLGVRDARPQKMFGQGDAHLKT